MSTSSGSRVRRDGTIAMSSNPYARRAFLPRPISTSIAASYRLRTRTAVRRAIESGQVAMAAATSRALDASSGARAGYRRASARDSRRSRASSARSRRRSRACSASTSAQQPVDLAQGRACRRRSAGPTRHRRRRRSAGTRPASARRSERRRSRPGTRRPSRSLERASCSSTRTRYSVGRAALEHVRVAAVRDRHDRLARRPSRVISTTALGAVVVVVELVADQLLGLELVRRDHVGLGAHGEPQRLAVGVDDRGHAELPELADQTGVDVRSHAARQAAGEHAHARALGQVQQLVAEQLELVRGDRRPALVDLGLDARSWGRAPRCSCATPRGSARTR